MDEASNEWVGIASVLAPTKDRWVIRQEGVVGKADLSHVPPDHILTVPTGATASDIRKLVVEKGLPASRNATVIVDMDLNSVNVPVANPKAWDKPTQWAARVVEAVADEHLKDHPDFHTMWIGHSAGTEPMTMVPAQAEKGGRPMFNDIYAMSARRFEADYPKNTVMVFADHDFLASPKGDVPVGSITGSFSEADAKKIAQLGYSVVRIAAEDGGSGSAMSQAGRDLLVAIGAGAVVLGDVYQERKAAHTESHDVAYPDRQMFYYAPTTAEATPIPTHSLGRALKAASEVKSGVSANFAAAAKKMGHDEPTKGIGGISLNATAYLPLDPKDVESAGYTAADNRLFLTLRSGQVIRFPSMDAEVLRQGYDTGYVNDEKAELSISRTVAQDAGGRWVSNPRGPGDFAVYYFGHSENTQLGLAMFEADHRLGQFAFENPPQTPDLLPRFPGLRSLPELFPERYTDNPADERFGSGLRVFLTTSSVGLGLTPKGDALVFDDTTFAVHFGNMGPAEAAFAGFFESHFNEIAATGPGRPFAQLVPYARSIAIFRWLKSHDIAVEADQLEEIAVANVYTPTAVPVHGRIRLEDIAPPLPTIFFGLNGPVRVIGTDAKETLFSYDEGLLSAVRRADGARFQVFRDALGTPIGLTWGMGKSVAFVQDSAHGLILAKGIDLKRSGDELAVAYRDGASYFPASNSEKILAAVALRFAEGEDP